MFGWPFGIGYSALSDEMSNITKQDILEAIRQVATENGGKPLGAAGFEKETEINSYDGGEYWDRLGGAQQEAEFMPNQFQGAHADQFLIEKIIGLARKLGKFPTCREITVERSSDAEFPSRIHRTNIIPRSSRGPALAEARIRSSIKDFEDDTSCRFPMN